MATAGLLGSILNQLGGIPPARSRSAIALDLLSSTAAAGNPYAPAIGGVATELLGGGPDRTPWSTMPMSSIAGVVALFASGLSRSVHHAGVSNRSII